MSERSPRWVVRHPIGLPSAAPVSGRRATDELLWLQDFATAPVNSDDALARAQTGLLHFAWSRSGLRLADHPGGGTTMPTADDVRAVQRELRRLFDRLRDGGDGLVWLPEAPMRFGLRVHGRGRYLVSDSNASVIGPFYAAVAELLARIPGELRQCDADGCPRLYAPHRPQQRYCSRPCQNRSTMAQYIANHPTGAAAARKERRHAAIKKRLGAKVQVGQRRK